MNSVTHVSLKILIPLLASIVAITPLAIDMYLPAMPLLVSEFDVTESVIQYSLSLYLVFFALGALTFGPLADRYGRRPFVIGGLLGFSVSSLALASIQSAELFLLFRCTQAYTGVAASLVVPGIIRQRFGQNTAKGLSYVSMVMMLAPLLAPAIGSLLMELSDWRLIFYALAAYGLLTVLAATVLLKEAEIAAPTTPFHWRTLYLDKYKKVLGNSAARMNIASSMFAAFAFFCYLTAIPFVYIDHFGASETLFSVLFGVNVIGLMIGNFINTRTVPRIGSQQMLLYTLSLAGVSVTALILVLSLGLGIYWTAACILPLMASLSLTAVNADALILIEFEEDSGTATAVLSTLKFAAGGIVGPLLAIMPGGTSLPFALLMFFGVVAIALCQWRNRTQQSHQTHSESALS